MTYAAFFDVDETLIRCKSMLDFLEFLIAHSSDVEADRIRRGRSELLVQQQRGVARDELNRAYYRMYAGLAVAKISELAERWYVLRSGEHEFYIAATRRALEEHKASGAQIALVSGSFAALLAPIARAVSADALLCTRMVVDADAYTGEIEQSMIGIGKAAAVQAYLALSPELDPERCSAYGDDSSDIPMLDCVGQPRMVGANQALYDYIRRRR